METVQKCPRCDAYLVVVNSYGMQQCPSCKKGVYDPEYGWINEEAKSKVIYVPMSGFSNVSGIIAKVHRKYRSVRLAIQELKVEPLVLVEPGYQGLKALFNQSQVALIQEYFSQPKGNHRAFALKMTYSDGKMIRIEEAR